MAAVSAEHHRTAASGELNLAPMALPAAPASALPCTQLQPHRQPQHRPQHRAPVCRYFHSTGGCARGTQCRFEHLGAPNRSRPSQQSADAATTCAPASASAPPLPLPPPPPAAPNTAPASLLLSPSVPDATDAAVASRRATCKFYLAPDGCARGARCRFLHPATAAPSSAAIASASAAPDFSGPILESRSSPGLGPGPGPDPGPGLDRNPGPRPGPSASPIPPPSQSPPPPRSSPSSPSSSLSPSSSADTQPNHAHGSAGAGAHQSVSTQHQPNAPPKVPGRCQWYHRGFCARGARCWFAHDLAGPSAGARAGAGVADYAAAVEALRVEAQADAEAGASAGVAGEGGAGAGAGMWRPACSICFDVPETYALLPSCDHIFCLACLREWRQPAAAAETPSNAHARFQSKACPMCRKVNRFIVPASFYVKGAAKRRMLRSFRARTKDIPCRHIAASTAPTASSTGAAHGSPHCPFGGAYHPRVASLAAIPLPLSSVPRPWLCL